MVELESFRIVPGGLRGLVVVDGTVHHDFQGFVVLSVDDEVFECISEFLDMLQLKWYWICLLQTFVVELPLVVEHFCPLFRYWKLW